MSKKLDEKMSELSEELKPDDGERLFDDKYPKRLRVDGYNSELSQNDQQEYGAAIMI